MNKLIGFSRFHLQEKTPKECFVKDPVHKEIDFSINKYWLYELVNTFEMQRLSNLRQLSLTVFNFPSGTHTRLMHSLGVYELCSRFIDHFLSSGDLVLEKDWKEINVALAYALLHDIGHGPLSHAFEDTVKNFNHEKMGLKIIKSSSTKVNFLLRKKSIDDGLDEFYYVNELEKIFNKTTEHRWIMDLVSSDIDVDRLDFLLRDSYYTGVSYGNTVDISLLIKWSVVKKDKSGNRRFSFLTKAKNQLEQFLSARKKMYVDLYRNDVTEAYEYLFKKLFSYFQKNPKEFVDGEGFGRLNFLLEPMDNWKIEDFLYLNDFRILEILESLFSNVSGEIKIYYDFMFGNAYESDLKTFLSKDSKFKKVGVSKKNIKIELWDPEVQDFVEAKL